MISDKRLDTRNIVIGSSAPAQMTFRNNYDNEVRSAAGGSVLGWVSAGSVDQWGTVLDIIDPAMGGSFVSGGYNGEIDGTANNPLAAQQAWCGETSGGYINSVINLGANVDGQTIVLRFRMGTDEAIAAPGRRIDTAGDDRRILSINY